MKTSRKFLSAVALAIVAILLPTQGHAQISQTYTGGTGTWDTGITPSWTGTSGTTWVGGDDIAVFNGASNTVTVSGSVNVDQMQFSSGGTTISGGTINENPFTKQNYETQVGTNGDETFISDTQNAPVTINSPIIVHDLGENQQDFLNNSGNSTLTINNVDFGAYILNTSATASRRMNFQDLGSGAITVNGTFTTSAGHGGSLVFGPNGAGTYNITSSANFSNFNGGSNSFVLDGNTLNIANSTFTSSQTLALQYQPANSTVNIVGAQNIALAIYDSMKNSGTKASDGVNIMGVATFVQNTANKSTWTGSVNLDGTSIALGAVAGGRLTWSGNLGGDAPQGLVKTGAGVVVLSNATGNSYDERDGNGHLQPTSTVAADIQAGTLLITNTSGSAFGIASNGDSFYGNSGSHNNVVDIESGATLGGTGISARPVVEVAAGSIIAPGDPGQAGLGIAPSLGTLHLTGGVTASSGATLAFKLSFSTNDQLDLGSGAFTLGGTVTVDLSDLGSVQDGHTYLLASGSGAWTDPGASFLINFAGPNGEHVDSYSFDTTHDTFSVHVVPEPATWLLMGLGTLFLFWRVRRRNAANELKFVNSRLLEKISDS